MSSSDAFNLAVNIALVIVGWALPKIWDWTYSRFRLRMLGIVFPTTPGGGGNVCIHVRASLDELEFGSNPPTLRGYTHSGDILAVMDIMEHFRGLPAKIDFDYFSEIKEMMRNVVIIGGSKTSDISRDISKELITRGYRRDGDAAHAYYLDPSGKEYHCEHIVHDGKNIVSKDAGIIYRTRSDNGCEILFCGGLHTFGSQAAVAVALSKDFQKKVRETKARSFLQFVTVEIATDGPRAGLALKRQSIRWREFPLVELEDRRD